MAALYSVKGGGYETQRCPGEAACEFFAAAAGATRADKLINSCRDCHLLDSKPEAGELLLSDDDAEAQLELVEQVRYERDSSKLPLDLTEISYLTWRLVQIYDAQIEGHERMLRIETKEWLKALAQRGI